MSPRDSIPAWWQAGPFAAVFAFFFIAPLLLIAAVSFWPTSDYELIPGFTFDTNTLPSPPIALASARAAILPPRTLSDAM